MFTANNLKDKIKIDSDQYNMIREENYYLKEKLEILQDSKNNLLKENTELLQKVYELSKELVKIQQKG